MADIRKDARVLTRFAHGQHPVALVAGPTHRPPIGFSATVRVSWHTCLKTSGTSSCATHPESHAGKMVVLSNCKGLILLALVHMDAFAKSTGRQSWLVSSRGFVMRWVTTQRVQCIEQGVTWSRKGCCLCVKPSSCDQPHAPDKICKMGRASGQWTIRPATR